MECSSAENIANKKESLLTSFTQCPNWIKQMPGVTISDREVYEALLSFIRPGGKGLCFPSREQIAEKAGVSIRGVTRGVTKLIKLKIIQRKIKANEHRTYYYILSVPIETLAKCGESAMKIEEKRAKANKAVEEARERLARTRDAKLVKTRSHLSDAATIKPVTEKTPRDTSAFNTAKFYTEVFKKSCPQMQGIMITQKEMAQIKKFIEAYGMDSLRSIIIDFFARWDYYKSIWKIDADYPTIGILVSYGKSKVVSLHKESVVTPADDGKPKPVIEMPSAGW